MIKRNFAVLVVAGLVLGGGALALAQGPPDRPGTEPGAARGRADREAERQAFRDCRQRAGQDQAARRQCRQQFGPGKHGGGPLRRVVHGDLVVQGDDGQFENVTVDRGAVNEATDTSKLVLDRPDGKQVTFELTTETRYRGVEGAAQLRKGQPAMVTSRDGKALTVGQRDPNKGAGKGPGGPGNNQAPPGVPND